jgi:DNA-binding transcriptional ArsR family regulator
MSERFELRSANGTNLEVSPGDYYFNTKARGRRMMRDSLSGDARRVYACLELATMGFRQELAVTMERGKQRPLTPGDVARQTGLSKQNVRRALRELEDTGLAERRADYGAQLRHGHVQIYSWAVPRDSKKKERSRDRLVPAWFPASWEPFRPIIARLKLRLIEDETVARPYFEEGEGIAHDYQKVQEVVRSFLERVSAQRRTNKEERTERTIERNAGRRESSARNTDIAGAPASRPELGELEAGLRRRGFGPLDFSGPDPRRVRLGASRLVL